MVLKIQIGLPLLGIRTLQQPTKTESAWDSSLCSAPLQLSQGCFDTAKGKAHYVSVKLLHKRAQGLSISSLLVLYELLGGIDIVCDLQHSKIFVRCCAEALFQWKQLHAGNCGHS